MKKTMTALAAASVVFGSLSMAVPAYAAGDVFTSVKAPGSCTVGAPCTFGYDYQWFGATDSGYESLTVNVAGAGTSDSRTVTLSHSVAPQKSGSITVTPTTGGTITADFAGSSASVNVPDPIRPPSNPTGPSLKATSSTTATFSWGDPYSGGPLTGFHVKGPGVDTVVSSGTYSFSASGLTPGSRVEFSVAAVNAGGESGFSPAAVTMPDAPKPDPTPTPTPKPDPTPGPTPKPTPPAPNGGDTNNNASITPVDTAAEGAPANVDGTTDRDNHASSVQQRVSAKWPTKAISGKTVRIGNLKTNAGVEATLKVAKKSPSVQSVSIIKTGNVTSVKVVLKKGAASGSVNLVVDAPATPGFEAMAASHVLKVVR